MSIYLDHAATTPMTDAARAAVAAGMARWANPSSPHAAGRAARAALEAARAAIGAAYDWPGEVLLTSGASESLAIVLGRGTAMPRIVSTVEHDSVIRAAPDAYRAPVDGAGIVDADRLVAAMACAPALVAIQWANSETGVIQPVAPLAARVRAAGGLVLLDAAQMPPGADPAAIAAADFVALSAHKHGGPPGTGALLVRDLAALSPTGGQERGYRPGTENLPGVLGHAAALADPADLARLAGLRARLDDAIARSGGEPVAAGARRYPAIASYRLPGVASATQLIRLDLAGFAVSAGSACASGSMKPSHVLAAMGWSEAASREVIRVSLGRATTADEVEAFVAAWRATARGARRLVA